MCVRGNGHVCCRGAGCSLADVSLLGGVHTLSLIMCTGLVDVGALGNGVVHALHLAFCSNVHDISALGTVRPLSCNVKRWFANRSELRK